MAVTLRPGWTTAGVAIAAALAIAAGGGVADAYHAFWWYDILAHTVSGFGFTLGLIRVTYGRTIDGVRTHPALFVGTVVLLGIGIGSIWEWMEFAYDHLSGPDNAIRGKFDT